MLALTSQTGSGEVATCHLKNSGLEGSPPSFRSILSPPWSPAPLMKSSLILASGASYDLITFLHLIYGIYCKLALMLITDLQLISVT